MERSIETFQNLAKFFNQKSLRDRHHRGSEINILILKLLEINNRIGS